MIQEQFDKVIKYSQHLNNIDINTNELFAEWEKNKKPIIDTFLNGQLMYTYPEKISFTLDSTSQEERYHSFVEYVCRLMDTDDEDEFIDYLSRIGYENFYNNVLDTDFFTYSDKKIQKGTRVVKSFKYFISNPDLLSDIQNKASNIIQENKVEGYLTFSVHPLDYLSVSETTYNWRSCHALDGEFRAGNLSYMRDKSTVVCYLSNGDQAAHLPRFPEDVSWNSKKWRCLLFFDTQLKSVFAGRQYPFFSPGALEVVREVFYNELVKEEDGGWFGGIRPHWSHWHDEYIKECHYNNHPEDDYFGLDDRYFYMNGLILKLEDIVQNVKHSLQFNDLLSSSCYEYPFYMFRRVRRDADEIKFRIGGGVRCLCCGEEYIENPGSVLCDNCMYGNIEEDQDEYHECSCCGNHSYIGNMSVVEGELVCPSCAEAEAFVCEECWDKFYNDKKHWVEEKEVFMCDTCYEKYLKDKEEEPEPKGRNIFHLMERELSRIFD